MDEFWDESVEQAMGCGFSEDETVDNGDLPLNEEWEG